MEERNTSGSLRSQDPTTSSLRAEVNETREGCRTELQDCHLQLQILFWLVLIIAVVGIAGNAAVFWLLRFRMRRNAILVYILNLSAADSITLCYFTIIRIWQHFNPSSFKNPLFLFFFNVVGISSNISGLSMLSAISTERCLSILWPIWYRCRRPKHTSAVTCGLLLGIVLLLSILEECACTIKLPKIDNWCLTLGYFVTTYLIVLFVILSGSSVALVLRIFCGSHRIRITRLCVTILLTVLVFLLCGLPLSMNYFLIYKFHGLCDFPCFYHRLLIFLSCVNSSANPFIYFFVGSFRQQKHQSLKLVLQRALQDTPLRSDTGDSLPRETVEMSGSRV